MAWPKGKAREAKSKVEKKETSKPKTTATIINAIQLIKDANDILRNENERLKKRNAILEAELKNNQTTLKDIQNKLLE